MTNYQFEIEWYGHCCYKIVYAGITFLLDPYDTFQSIDCGIIKSNYLLSSSSWHDHGHIGASPMSQVFTYPGEYNFDKGFTIYGIKTFESRGSQNTIFSVHFNDGFSFTNFADWGDENGISKLTKKELAILSQTKIAFTRINCINEKEKFFCYDLALQTCNPNIIFPEHYFPESFILNNLPKEKQQEYLNKLAQVEYMRKKVSFNYKYINSSVSTISFNQDTKDFIEFVNINKNVKFLK